MVSIRRQSLQGGPVTPVHIYGSEYLTIRPNTGVEAITVSIGPTDPISDIPVIIDFDHHQVHEGETHEYCNLTATLNLNANKDFRINVPATATSVLGAPHMLVETITTQECEAYLYENMTYTAGNGGTARQSFNRNRLAWAIVAKTVIYETPTPASLGTLLWIGLTGSGNKAGSASRSITEHILAPGDYLYRITSRVNGTKVLVRFEWYEDLGV